MLFSSTIFIGIDPTAGKRPFAYAALDDNCSIIALGQADMENILAFIVGQQKTIVGICSPARPNIGLMSREDIRENLSPPPKPGRWINYRVCEYLLRQKKISAAQTVGDGKKCPNWMKKGFQLYNRLSNFGFSPFPASNTEKLFLEIYPHASYSILLGHNPFPKHTLEGRIQRQLILYEHNLDLPDSMRFFEEITAHKLLRGLLPYDMLKSPEELDALIAAYTAWLAIHQPTKILLVGDPIEGQIAVPGVELSLKHTISS